MRKITLAVLGFFFQLFGAFAQDTSAFKARKLRLEEVNFVSGYYMQDGNHSAVTGGVGTEKLTDFANTLTVTAIKNGTHGRQYTWGLEVGIDHYTSASSDNIDPSTVSGPSSGDTRIYPSLSWAVKNAKGNTFGLQASYSTEFDYKSMGLGASYSRVSADRNRELSFHLQSYFDQWSVIYPVELRPLYHSESSQPRNSFSGSLVLSQVVNSRLQIAALIDGIYQSGLLATNYQRVYFTDNTEHIEVLPDTRFKIPIGLRASVFLGDRFIIRGWYRYYFDNWNIRAHALNLEMPVKLSPFTSVHAFYRYYTQTAADYFAPYGMHNPADKFYTSDYDLSALSSHFIGAGVRFAPEKGVMKIRHWSALEVRYGHYTRSTDLASDIITLYATFK